MIILIDDQDGEQKSIEYLIPSNVSTKFEFFPGFGWSEFKIVFIACVIGILIYSGLGLFKKTSYVNSINTPAGAIINSEGLMEKKVPVIPGMIRIFAIIIPGAGSFFLVKRDPSNGMSLLFTVKSASEFKKRQKLYLYKYGSGTEEF